MKILFSLYNANYDTSETTLVYSKWICVESGIEAIKTIIGTHFAFNGGYQYEAYLGQNLSFCDFYCFFHNAKDLIPTVESLDDPACKTEQPRFPSVLRICEDEQQAAEIIEGNNQQNVFLYYRSRYECGASGLEDILLQVISNPFIIFFKICIDGFIWDFTKRVFSRIKTAIVGKKSKKPVDNEFVFRAKKFYKNFENLTKIKTEDCQIISFKKKKKGKYQITVRTIKNELYKVRSMSNGIIESIEPISIEDFQAKALRGPSPDSQ